MGCCDSNLRWISLGIAFLGFLYYSTKAVNEFHIKHENNLDGNLKLIVSLIGISSMVLLVIAILKEKAPWILICLISDFFINLCVLVLYVIMPMMDDERSKDPWYINIPYIFYFGEFLYIFQYITKIYFFFSYCHLLLVFVVPVLQKS